MTRLNTEYVAKLKSSHLQQAKLSTDFAVFKEELSIRQALKKEHAEILDES